MFKFLKYTQDATKYITNKLYSTCSNAVNFFYPVNQEQNQEKQNFLDINYKSMNNSDVFKSEIELNNKETNHGVISVQNNLEEIVSLKSSSKSENIEQSMNHDSFVELDPSKFFQSLSDNSESAENIDASNSATLGQSMFFQNLEKDSNHQNLLSKDDTFLAANEIESSEVINNTVPQNHELSVINEIATEEEYDIEYVIKQAYKQNKIVVTRKELENSNNILANNTKLILKMIEKEEYETKHEFKNNETVFIFNHEKIEEAITANISDSEIKSIGNGIEKKEHEQGIVIPRIKPTLVQSTIFIAEEIDYDKKPAESIIFRQEEIDYDKELKELRKGIMEKLESNPFIDAHTNYPEPKIEMFGQCYINNIDDVSNQSDA